MSKGSVNELALCAGAGGGIYGSLLLGHRVVCAVEHNRHCQRVLLQRQREGIFPPFPVWDELETFDGRPWRGIVDLVSAGWPCQDISIAGKGAGLDGKKSGLWRHVARVIREVEPGGVFLENSPHIVSRGLGRVLGDLASMGFAAEWGMFTASSVGALHQRKRWFLVAYSDGKGFASESIPAEQDATRPRLPASLVLPHAIGQRRKELDVPESQATKRMGRHGTVISAAMVLGLAKPGDYANPDWWDWLMMWPIGASGSQPLEMDKFQAWLSAHGVSLAVD